MFKYLLGIGLIAVMVVGLTACSDVKVTTYPTGNNSYKLIATSSSEADAMQGASEKAKQICQTQKMNFKVVSVNTKYQGAYDKATAKTVDIVTDAAGVVTGNFFGGAKSQNDYLTTMKFECVE